MGMQYVPPKGSRKITFWLKSSRGTDVMRNVSVPKEWTNEDIQSELEEWCSQFGAWQVSDNFVRYGWRERNGKVWKRTNK